MNLNKASPALESLTKEEAQSLGLYEAEWYSSKQDKWFGCGPLCRFTDDDGQYRRAPADHADRRISPKQAAKLHPSEVEASWGTECYWSSIDEARSTCEDEPNVYRLKLGTKTTLPVDDFISNEEAMQLGAGNAEWYIPAHSAWRECGPDCLYLPQYKYRRKGSTITVQRAIQLEGSPETVSLTLKDLTMSNIYVDATIPVQTITLIHGKEVKDFTDNDLLNSIRKIDADIETYTKSNTGSARIAAKLAELKAQRAQIIATYDAAAPAAEEAAGPV